MGNHLTLSEIEDRKTDYLKRNHLISIHIHGLYNIYEKAKTIIPWF